MSERQKPPIALLAESTAQIGTGHFVEIANLARAAMDRNLSVEIWVNKDAPKNILEFAPLPPELINNFSPENLEQLAQDLTRRDCVLAVTSFRRMTNLQIRALRHNGIKVACIDELGNAALDCELVINPSIVPQYHRYSSQNPRFRVCAGPQYMFLSPEYKELHLQPRTHNGRIQNLTISMGGVDRSGATIRIVESLLGWRSDVNKHVVVGPGFAHADALESMLATFGDNGFQIHRGLRSLAELFMQSDVVFSAGGNTLYELACLGTPAIVLYEDPHEREQGLAFQEKGFGICPGSGADASFDQIHSALDELDSPEQRQAMHDAGRSLVDGNGVERVIALALGLMNDDSSV